MDSSAEDGSGGRCRVPFPFKTLQPVKPCLSLKFHQMLLPVDWSCVIIANLLLLCIVAHT